MRLLIICPLLFISCQIQSEKQTPAGKLGTAGELPADFIEFYQRFHDDSVYQLEHIQFPLSGLPANADTMETSAGTFKWKQSNWKIHKPIDSTLTGYVKSFRKFDDGVIIEIITQRQVGIGMERRFVKMDGNWQLIYYAGMNYLL